jgi:hypothetical protein
VGAGNPTADQDLAQILTEQVQVSKKRSAFANGIQPRNWDSPRVDYSLSGVMFGASLCVGQNRPDRNHVIRRLGKRDHCFRRPAEIQVSALCDPFVPPSKRGAEFFFLEALGRGKRLERIITFDPAAFDFLEVVFAPDIPVFRMRSQRIGDSSKASARHAVPRCQARL